MTEKLCVFLVDTLKNLALKKLAASEPPVVSILDAACGDLFWMVHCLPRIVDVLPEGVR